MFSFPFLEGNAKAAFKEVNSVVITQSVAKKYFGEEAPMGKVLQVGRLGDLMVAGVLKDLPENGHFHFTVVGYRKYRG